MEVIEALDVLGVGRDASWQTIRRAHRTSIVAAHPDTGGSAASAARINQALDVLRRATDDGRTPLPDPAPAPPRRDVAPRPDGAPTTRVPLHDPIEVLLRLADAAHDVGEVVFVDPIDGLLEVIVGDEPGVGQLTASVDAAGDDGVPVAFTLEPLGVAPAPPIGDVVAALMRRFRNGAGDDAGAAEA